MQPRLGPFTTGLLCCASVWMLRGPSVTAQAPSRVRPEPTTHALHLARPTHPGAFFDVLGRRAAVLGYENRAAEAWVYPLEILDDFSLSFSLEGYPLAFEGRDVMATIDVRPAATTFTYTHAAFSVRQTIIVPRNEPGIVMLLDVTSVLPLTITASFRPRLRLMWPATSMTPNVGWDGNAHVYYVTEDSGAYAAVIGSPQGRDVSLMPYQEEPRGVATRFVVAESRDSVQSTVIPLVMTASVDGRAAAKAAYDRLLASARASYDETAAEYARLDENTMRVGTPDPRVDTAFEWAKVGIDKGLASNPWLGTGLLAGFRTSGDSERPGYAWFFGRDAMWTALAIDAYGDFSAARTALEFLRKYQRADGKIPHEISQSATVVQWFERFPYAWASADATPLYVLASADYWQATGDRAFLDAAWPSILKAYQFSAQTDRDGNGLIENTGVGHGWVEGGALSPPHEELYMQGLWIAASRAAAELAGVMNDAATAAAALAAAARTRAAMERTYWLPADGYYAFATVLPRSSPSVAEPGPGRAVRQKRLDMLSTAHLIDEDTVLPAVPLWFGAMDDERAQLEIDHLGSAALATDWGHRILSNRSALYDPLSYHYGSVWPLFTGWAAVAAYRYGRPHVGYQALMANALLTEAGALGDVTELLSGDFPVPFGRSSHHQVWSQAMVVLPIVRGLLGLAVRDAGRTLRFAPDLPADWDRVTVRSIAAADRRFDITFDRRPGRAVISLERRQGDGADRFVVAPAFPLDARVRDVRVNGRTASHTVTRIGDVQRAEVVAEAAGPVEIVFTYDEGTDVYVDHEPPVAGAMNEGLRVLRATAAPDRLRVILEGRAGRTYLLHVRTPKRLGAVDGVRMLPARGPDRDVEVTFSGALPMTAYVRREIILPLLAPGVRR
ncbi:MAG TPA: GH116 family glycosyl hydrolase [Vicinamibacterales bacterium]|nr:GH116 family glycosyl hydrolase [Vicinamibacterales bacterium]